VIQVIHFPKVESPLLTKIARVVPRESGNIRGGGMAEWFKAAVLKTVDGESYPGVRIPLPPPSP
jgi:hypothetical protein